MNRVKSLLIILVSLTMWGCNQPEPQRLRLGTNIWPGYEPLYLAREIGVLPSNKVHLVEYPSASEVIRAFRNKALEMASLTLDEVLLLVQDDIPVKVILVHDISNGADAILARPEITSMRDIVGKRVAVESSALGAYVITRALELNKLSLKDIIIKHLDVNQHEKAYKNNQVDAVVNFEPVRTRLLNKGAKEIFTSKEMYGEIVDVLVVHEEVFKQNKSVLKEIVNAWFTALDYFSQQPQLAANIMAKRLNVSPREVIASFEGLELPNRKINRTLLGGKKPKLRITIQHLSRVLKENKLLYKDVENPDILIEDFL